MRVLLALAVLEENGAVRVDLDLAREWTRAGHPTRVLVLQPVPEGRSAPADGVDVRWGTTRVERFRTALLRIVPRVLAHARSADVVVSGSEIGEGLILAQLAAQLLRKPFVVVVHASPSYMVEHWVPRRLRAANLRAIAAADAAVCVSQDLVAEVVALGVAPERVTHVANGRDVHGLRERAASLRREAPEQPLPVVVGLGRLTAQKGFDLLIRAHARVAPRVPHLLRIYGEGPLRAELEALAAALGVADSVEMPGFATDAPAALAQASLYCMPSRHEGQPLALLEALAMQLPVVAADCSAGVRQVVGDGAYADLVAVDSVDELAEALERHLRSPDVLRAKVLSATEHLDGYSTAVMAARYLDVLGALAPGRVAAKPGQDGGRDR